MEEKVMTNGELITILQKDLQQANIAAIAGQVIQQQRYRTKNMSSRCLQRQIILNLIAYIVYREGAQKVAKDEIVHLQFQIKRWFALLPAEERKNEEFKNSSHNFLTSLLLLSQVVHKILLKHRLVKRGTDAQTIFITVVYLATDKLVSPYCFALVHRRLQKHQLPNTKHKKIDEERSRYFSSKKSISIAQFQEEVKNVLNPSKKENHAERKKSHSVPIHRNQFQHKANREHSRLVQKLKENTEPSIPSINKIRKTHSQQNISKKGQPANSNVCFKWSKCELLNTEYIPFYVHQAAALKVREKAATNYLNYRVSKERLTINTEKPRLRLKV